MYEHKHDLILAKASIFICAVVLNLLSYLLWVFVWQVYNWLYASEKKMSLTTVDKHGDRLEASKGMILFLSLMIVQ